MPYEYTRENNICESECVLIQDRVEEFDKDGLPVKKGPVRRTVFCTVSSLYMRDTYAAFQAGIKPAWKVSVFYGDYDGELTVEYNGIVYSVYRTYVDGDNIELYLRKDAGQWDAELNL